MKYRRLGRAGIKVSEISIGGWLTFGGTIDEKTASEIISAAVDNGINFVDLADIYAKGNAERVFGKILPQYKRSDLVISSKVFWPMSDNINDRGLSRKHIIESIDKSLQRLATDYLDIYFCHRFDPDTEIEEIVRVMDDLMRQGKILYWGTSVWEAQQIESAVDVAERYNCYRPQAEQPRYNMIDRHIEPEIMPTCDKHGIGLVVWSPLAQGILTGKYNDGVPANSRGAASNWLKGDLTDENLEKVKKLMTIAGDHNIDMAQLALAWTLRRPEVSSAITGATRPEQLEANIKASAVALDQGTIDTIEQILGDSPSDKEL